MFEIIPVWAPLGARRFKELVESGYFTDVRFFRVIRKFMAQFGLAAVPDLNKVWKNKGAIKVHH